MSPEKVQLARGKKLLAFLFGLFILAPIPLNVVYGKPPWLPKQANEFWRFTDLFSHRPAAWPSHHVLVESNSEWREIPRALLFRYGLFGGMTRLDMTLLNFSLRRGDSAETESTKRRVLDRICREFLEAYVQAREREGLSGAWQAPRAVRLVRGWHLVVEGLPSERWSETLRPQQRFDVLHEYRPAD